MHGVTQQLMFDDPDGTFAMLCESVAGFASRYPGPKSLREKRARGGAVDKAIWSAMAEAGWIGLLLPEAIGGTGLGIREQVVLSEALGRALVVEPMVMASVFSSLLVAEAPNSAERARLAAGIARGSIVAIPAWNEAARPLRCRSVSAGAAHEGVVLSGEKRFVDAAKSATDFLVTAEADDGCSLVSVAADTDGLTITERPGIDGASIAVLTFAGSRQAARWHTWRVPPTCSTGPCCMRGWRWPPSLPGLRQGRSNSPLAIQGTGPSSASRSPASRPFSTGWSTCGWTRNSPVRPSSMR